ncbi:MAG: T9SS type A sorting domain-containing protein, partial [Bacteroidota bacterium]
FQGSAGFWLEVQILQVIDSATPQAESFGSSMEVNGGYALIGAPQIDRYGACWMFKKVGGNWQKWYKITPNYQPVPTSGEGFGHSVSFNGWHLMIGMPFRNAMIPNPNNTLYSGQVGGLFFYEFTINALSLEKIAQTQKLSLSPNPSISLTNVHFTLPKSQTLSIEITDLSGKIIRRRLLRRLPQGEHTVALPTKGISSGVYLVVIKGESMQAMGKLIINAQ